MRLRKLNLIFIFVSPLFKVEHDWPLLLSASVVLRLAKVKFARVFWHGESKQQRLLIRAGVFASDIKLLYHLFSPCVKSSLLRLCIPNDHED